MRKIQTEDERRKPIVAKMIDDYVRDKFQGICNGGRNGIFIPALEANKLIPKILAVVEGGD